MEHCGSPVPLELPAISDGRMMQNATTGRSIKEPVTSDIRRHDDMSLIATSSLIAAARRLGMLEDRMVHQEATLRTLMERAFGIQQQMESIRSVAHSGLEHEQRERRLIQDHVQTVTNLVNQFHQQIMNLRQTLHNSERCVQQQAHVITQLENSHRNFTSEVRPSLYHNASMLSQLSARFKACEGEVSKLRKQQENDQAQHLDAQRQLQQQLSAVQSRLQQLSKEQQTNAQRAEIALKHVSDRIDMSAHQQSENLKQAIAEVHSSCQEHCNSILSKAVHLCEETDHSHQAHHKQVDDKVSTLSHSIHRLQEALRSESQACLHLTQQLHDQHLSLANSQQQSSKQLEESFKASLQEVHKSLSSLQQLINTKQDLLFKRVHKEIQRVLNTIVVV